MPTEGISNQESSLSAEKPPVMGDGSKSEEVEAATPPIISQPPVSVGVGPKDVPTPSSETVPSTLGATAAGDTEKPAEVAQEVSTQSTPDIPAPQENTEAPAELSTTPPAESVPSLETTSPEPSADGKSLDGVGAPKAENINPHKMEPHDLEATVGTGSDQSSLSSETTPPPVPEDSNLTSPQPEMASISPQPPASQEMPASASLDQSVPSAPIPERITPEEQAPEAERGEDVISILDRMQSDLDELRKQAAKNSPETTTNREAA